MFNAFIKIFQKLQQALMENEKLKCQLETCKNQYENDVTQLSQNLENNNDNLNIQIAQNKEILQQLNHYKIQDELQKHKLDELTTQVNRATEVISNAVTSIKNVILVSQHFYAFTNIFQR